MKQKKLIFIFAALALLMTAGGVSAYFTSMDQNTNTWTTGNITIELQEPEYDKIPQIERENITPNQKLTKDPLIKNTGSNEAYVFLRFSVPKANVKTAAADGTLQPSAQQELFSYTIHSGWTKVSEDNSSADNNSYIYAYGSSSGCTPLSSGAATPPLFQDSRIVFKNIIEGQGLQNKNLEIPVQAFGIQTSDLGTNSTSLPSEVWKILTNQADPSVSD